MKALRIINASFWAATSITLTTLVAIAWRNLGCEVQSLVLATAFYLAVSVGLGLFFDVMIKENNK